MRSRDTFTSEQRRAQLVDAAITVIANDGYFAASIAKIAEHVGIAKSVALYHFATKDALIKAVVESVFGAAAAAIVPALAAEHTATGKLAAYIRANAGFLADHRDQTIAVHDIVNNYRTPDGRRFDEAAAEEVAHNPPQGDLALLDPAAIFALGVASGEFRSDLDPVGAGSALRGALDNAAVYHARFDTYDPRAFGEVLVDLFNYGVRS